MNQGEENKQCQICKGYLFPDDDVVICPHCGAPHHRDCWNTVGQCGVEADHGTENQYDKLKAKEAEQNKEGPDAESVRKCGFCGRESHSTEGDFCPYCGHPYGHSEHAGRRNQHGPNVFVGGMPYTVNPYGGFDKDTEIEGVKVEHIAKFVGSNSHRYVPRFSALTKKNKGSWNWAAFLSPAAWCFSRKMYLYGVIFFIVTLAVGICGYPFLVEYNQFLSESDTAFRSAYAVISQNFDQFSLVPLIMMSVGGVIELIMMVLVGRYGDWLYRTFTLDKVRKITSDKMVEDVGTELASQGSVSFFWMMVVLIVGNYLPQIIAQLFW